MQSGHDPYLFGSGEPREPSDVLANIDNGDFDSVADCFPRWFRIVASHVRCPPVRGGAGLVVLLYGGHFKNAAVVAQAFYGMQFEQFRLQCNGILCEMLRARREAEQLHAGNEVGNSPQLQLGRIAATPQARALLSSVADLQRSIAMQVLAALNDNAARIMIGLDVGAWLAQRVGDRLEALYLTRLVSNDDRMDPRAVEEHRAWFRLIFDSMCSASGVAVCWALRGWAALGATCVLGGRLCVDALQDAGWTLPAVPALPPWASLLGGSAFLYQSSYGGRPPLPSWPVGLPVWLLLAPLRMVDAGLLALT